jgi:uncharacterized protein YbjT (DUF2867 family)
MSKILAVIGATGQQGSGLINYMMNDPGLSTQYKIRAITRDISSEKAKLLKEKVEVVQADVTDPSSLGKALSGAHTLFSMTLPDLSSHAVEVEFCIGKSIADVAVKAGMAYIIFSTLPPVKEISSGKYTKVTAFDAKANIEKYIRGLPIKSAFFSPGSFMENFTGQPFLAPRRDPDGTWVLSRHVSPKSALPLIDCVGDTGKYVGAILAEPEKYEGKTFNAATALYTMDEIAAAISRSTGETVIYKQISVENFKKKVPFAVDMFTEGFSFGEEYGYYGPGTKESVAWAAENARGRLSTFDEYLQAHPLKLE